MKDPTTIREFRSKDTSGVVALVLGIQNDEFHLNLSICDQKDLTDIDAYYRARGGAFLVAENNGGAIIGTIGLMRLRDDLGVMKKFFVAADYRGKDRGVAMALYERFVEFARSKGLTQIILDTPSAAIRSHAFYRTAGFIQIERSELPMSYDFPERDTLFFQLKL
ncbi:MAG: GNAT family N-acetyltransferase [Sinobacteraceae bacterium]|nr:GNAT family N-acetyltransferase [Nevskiaceae bacterium]